MKKRTLPALLLALSMILHPAAVLATDAADAESVAAELADTEFSDAAVADAELTDTDSSESELSAPEEPEPVTIGISGDAAQATGTEPDARGLDATAGLTAPKALELDGEAILLFERSTGTMIYAKNIDQQRAPASLTKVMTRLLALEYGDLSVQIPVTETALETMDPAGSSSGLMVGEVYTLEELLYCLMVNSANDAALVIAEHLGGSQEGFVQMMNDRAAELGCTGTHFANSHGMHDEEHYSTARDLAKIMQAALEYEIFQLLYSTSVYEIPATELQDTRIAYSTNYLISTRITSDYYDSRVIGGKTGFTTPAGRCVTCVAEDDSYSYLAVVLGASAYDADGEITYSSFKTASQLFDFCLDRFAVAPILSEGDTVAKIPVHRGTTDATAIISAPVDALLPVSLTPSLLTAGYILPTSGLTAPLDGDTEIGTLAVYYHGVCIAQAPLLTTTTVLFLPYWKPWMQKTDSFSPIPVLY